MYCICGYALKGLLETIKTLSLNVCIQSCIIHTLRNFMRYVPYKNREAFIANLKKIYTAATEEIALT